MGSCKRHKSNEDDRDMISNLPDFIVGHILSFLPTKYAVRTSVLSKKWIYRWTFITDLHFEDREQRYFRKKIRKSAFLNFVYRVLLHLNTSSIQSFSLAVSEKYEPYHLDQWISAAVVSRGVKKLFVKRLFVKNVFSYRILESKSSEKELALSSHSLLKYKSLEELVLKVDRCDMRIPAFARLSSLTSLKLSGIKFIGDNSDNLHLDFPVLRTYKTKNCTWSSSVKSVTLKVPLLNVVSVKDMVCDRSLSAVSCVAIKFCTSHLTEFTYKGYLLPDTIVFDLSSTCIAYANVIIHPYQFELQSVQETVDLSSNFMKQFKNVKYLKFQQPKKCLYHHRNFENWVLQLTEDSLTDVPAFQKLNHLALGKVTGETLLALLLKTPHLKTLMFLELLQIDQELFSYDRVPVCFLTTLRVVKFMRLDGSEHHLSFAKFVMENALALKRLSFTHSWNSRGPDLEEVKEKLSTFKKCCSYLILEFSPVYVY